MKHSISYALFIALSVICISACELTEPGQKDEEYLARTYLKGRCMDTIYFWNEEVHKINSSKNVNDYETITDLFADLLYPKDRWSWMETGEEYTESVTGVVKGSWGISLGQTSPYLFEDNADLRSYLMRVRYIFPGSPFEEFGVTRGAILLGIGGPGYNLEYFDEAALNRLNAGLDSSPQTFSFRLTDGRDTTFTTGWAESLPTRPTLEVKVFTSEDYENLAEPVGYFNYLNFKAGFLDDINDAFDMITASGARKIILDLRYNTGGDADASQLMMDRLAPKSAAGKPYLTRTHNKLLKKNNLIEYISKLADSPFEDIYIITGNHTASASEVIINGLRPYFGNRLHLVGENTYGKPNGMYLLKFPPDADNFEDIKYVFLPISFYNKNSLGELIPDIGFDPDNLRYDDLFHDWGKDEDLVKACLDHISSGEYPQLPLYPKEDRTKASKPFLKGKPAHYDDIDPNGSGYRITLKYSN